MYGNVSHNTLITIIIPLQKYLLCIKNRILSNRVREGVHFARLKTYTLYFTSLAMRQFDGGVQMPLYQFTKVKYCCSLIARRAGTIQKDFDGNCTLYRISLWHYN